MTIQSIDEAKSNLEQLIDQAVNGEEIIISQEGKPSVKLVLVEQHAEKPHKPREPGAWQGKVCMADDFNETPEEIIKLFYGEKG